MPWQSSKDQTEDILQGQCNKWHWRKREVFSNVTLLGINRILVRSDNERTLLSLIEHVMSNLTGVELVQCSWNQGSWSRFARQRPEQSSSGDDALHAQRAEVRVCGAGAPAVRPQHVEVRVEEKQKIHDVRKTHIHEYSQPTETRGTVNDAVKASCWPWSTRHGPQSCILR